AQRLIAAEGGGVDRRSSVVQQSATKHVDGGGGRDRLVAGQRRAVEGQAGGGLVEDGAAACPSDSLVVGEGAIRDGQDAGIVDPSPCGGIAVGDRQVGQTQRHPTRDVEDAARVVAADGQLACAQPIDGQVLRDVELAAHQCDGLILQALSEDNRVVAVRG